MKMLKFEPTGRGNETIENDEFYISFNQHPCGNIPIFQSDGLSCETALCKDGAYFILNGDFRKEYLDLFEKGFDECKKFFDSKQELKSSWSI